MRCLYCGKELALLKRWTGGGEFCSDAHRQQYQDEYNQLALTRLLQAKPPGAEHAAATAKSEPAPAPEPAKPVRGRTTPPEKLAEKQPDKQVEKQAAASIKPIAPPKPAPQPAAPPTQQAPRVTPQVIPQVRKTEAPVQPPVRAIEPEPEPEFEQAVAVESAAEPEFEPIAESTEETFPEIDEEPAPAEMSGFLLELPVPVLAEVMAMSRSESDFENGAAPAIPTRQFESWETQLVTAGPVESASLDRFVDCDARPRDRKLEVRDFVRTTSVVGVDLDPAGETEMPQMIEEPMDILIFPHPPQGSPELWDEPWREFSYEKELGALARVAFRTTGVEDNEDASDPVESLKDAGILLTPAVVDQPVVLRSQPVAKPVEPPVVRPAPVRAALPPFAKPTPPKSAPAPVQAEPEAELVPVAANVAVSQSKVANAAKVESAAPAPRATTPLPLTLHGLAAGRGKPVQVFAAVSAGVDLQVPRSASLPLRPTMMLGPAVLDKPLEKPAEKTEEKKHDRTVVVKPSPGKAQPGRPDPRFANGKGRKDARPGQPEKPTQPEKPAQPEKIEAKEVARPEPPKKDADKKELEKSVAASAKTPERTIEKPQKETEPAGKFVAKPALQPEDHRPREASLPAPIAPSYNPPDLGLPSLNLDASGGFWTRLPVVGKAGLALGLVAVIVGLFFLMRGGGAVAATGPHIVEAPAITAAEGGWITDWGAEPGVRKVHELSILKPSLNLTDYRIDFEAQIESKALGWMYRAQDSKNYYVTKLEVVKPGLEPTVSLVRFAVVKGEESPRSQFPLTMPLRIDTLYKIRFDAIGNHFTTWVQDQKVDDWTDERLKTGGVGLYSDRGERISLKGSLRVAPLLMKK
jgi:hypothetical protein